MSQYKTRMHPAHSLSTLIPLRRPLPCLGPRLTLGLVSYCEVRCLHASDSSATLVTEQSLPRTDDTVPATGLPQSWGARDEARPPHGSKTMFFLPQLW